MSLDVNMATLTLSIDTQDDVDADELNRLTGQLRAELEDLDVESVGFMRDRAVPEGAKVLDPVTLGTLIVVVLPTVLPKVMEFIQAWTLRDEGHTVKIKVQRGDRSIEVEYPKAMTPEEAKKHIDLVMDELSEKKHH